LEFREDLDIHKTRMNGLSCGEESNMFSRFDTVPACDGQTDGRTDVQPISITCFSIAHARKNNKLLGDMSPVSAPMQVNFEPERVK